MVPRIVEILLGVWLMASPTVLDYAGNAAGTNDRIVGPLVVSVAGIAVAEVSRPFRWCQIVLGLWLLIAPWVFGHATVPLLNDLIVGVLLIVLATRGGQVSEAFGGGWPSLWRSEARGLSHSQ